MLKAAEAGKEKLWDCKGEEDCFAQLCAGRETHETKNRSHKKIFFVLFALSSYLCSLQTKVCCKSRDPQMQVLNCIGEYSLFVVLVQGT